MSFLTDEFIEHGQHSERKPPGPSTIFTLSRGFNSCNTRVATTCRGYPAASRPSSRHQWGSPSTRARAGIEGSREETMKSSSPPPPPLQRGRRPRAQKRRLPKHPPAEREARGLGRARQQGQRVRQGSRTGGAGRPTAQNRSPGAARQRCRQARSGKARPAARRVGGDAARVGDMTHALDEPEPAPRSCTRRE